MEIVPSSSDTRNLWASRSLAAFLFFAMLVIVSFPSNSWVSGFTKNYLSIHVVLEMIGIVVSFGIFTVGWTTSENARSADLLVLTVVSFAAGALDLGHTIGFTGMPDFITPNIQDKAIDFWLVSRYTSALSLLYVSLAKPREVKADWLRFSLLIGVVAWTALWYIVILYFPDSLPTMFRSGSGLLPIKIFLEWDVAIISATAGIVFARKGTRQSMISYHWISCACFIFAMSGFFFTRYRDFDDLYVFAGHVYKAIGFILIYRAVLVECVSRPYQEARQSADLALQANRSRTRFLANVSHEFRTPLGIISGFAEQIHKSESLGKDERAWADMVVRNSQQLGLLIDDLLDLAKAEHESIEIRPDAFNLHEAVLGVVESMRLQAKRKELALEFSAAQPAEEFLIWSDENRLRQVLVNLIGNSVKFTLKGFVKVSLKISEGDITLDIEDSGIGIPPEQAKNLFQPFMQADDPSRRRFGGTGLGLALSKKLSSLLEGDLRLEKSVLGEGSTFTLTLPSNRHKITIVPTNNPQSVFAATAERKNAKGTINLEGRNLLVAEDALDNQALLLIYFRPTGAKLVFAGNGAEAVELAKSENFDLILMDIQMPVMDGFEAVLKLRGEGYKGPILALSAHAHQGEIDRALNNGFDAYVTKPINRIRLWETIESLLK